MSERRKNIDQRVVRDLTESLGKMPPAATDMEESVLGALLMEKNAIIEVAGFLRSDHFYSEAYSEIYKAIITLFSQGDPIDMRTVVGQLRKTGKLELSGGAYGIAELTSKLSSAAHVEFHARVIVEMSMKRSLIQLASMVHQEAYEDTADVFDLIEKANLDLQSVLDNALNATSEKSLKDIAIAVVKEQQERQTGKHDGLNTGFGVIDKMLSGFRKTDLIVIAARPGMGKSAIIAQAAINIAKQGHPVGMFSLEMGANQLLQRAAVSETEIDSESVKKGILNDPDFVRFMHACGDLGELPFYIDDTAFMSIIELRARAMRMKSKYGIKLLIIDYLQLIKGLSDSGKTTNNRDQEIGIITRTLKGMAKELDIPVVALSQLNRSVETRGGSKRPLLSDLRESGCLTGDSLIYCPRLKKNVRIRELIHRNNFNILAFNGKNNKPMNAKKCWSTGVKSVFNISLLTGHSLQATANHKFMSVNGWRALKDFSDKDLLAIPINYSQEYTRKIPDSEVRLIGHFLSNGSCLKGQPIRYTCNTLDQDLSDSVISDAIASVGQVAPYKKEYNVKSIWTTVYFKPTFHLTHGKTSPVADLMRKYCLFDVRSKEKFIPDSFFFLPTSQIQELLKALFSGDGCAYYRESKGRKTLSISFSSASHELTKGVQSLLQSIGIVSKIDALKNAKGHSWYNLSITGMSNIEIFVRDVGFIQERKQQIMLDGWERYKSVIPGWTKVQYNEQRTLAFIPITSITPIGKKRVYDIEVPGDHSFMANGILAHNSIEQDADIVMFLYRPEYYKIMQDEDGNPTHGKCEVIIEKHRGGSTGTVLLKFIGKFTKFSEWIYYDNKPDYVGQQKSPLPKEGDAPIPFNDDNPF